jgi:glutaredoxin
MSHIIFYARAGCPHCHSVRAYLRALGEPFEERDPGASRDYLRHLLSVSAAADVPVVIVNGLVVVGYDVERLDAVVHEPPPPAPPDDDYTPEELSDSPDEVTESR